MKKTILTLIAVTTLFTTSCSSDDDNATVAVDNSFSIENLNSKSPFDFSNYTLQDIVDANGCTSTLMDYENTETLRNQNLRLSFSANERSLTTNLGGGTITATYTVIDDNIVFIDPTFNETIRLENVFLDGNQIYFDYTTFIGCPSGAQIDSTIKGRYTLD